MSLGYTYHNTTNVIHNTLHNYDSVVVDYVNLLANDPFVTQENVASELNISKDTLLNLNSTINPILR